jgi:beta-glucanase (GH16 family)
MAQVYRLVWEDEFNQFDSSDTNNYNRWDINRSTWNVEVVDFPANNEIQVYRDSRDNVRLENDPNESGDGMLVIESHRQNTTQNLGAWTSGRINSQGKFKFKYGLIEVRAKLPPLLGSWPAIWMMGDNIASLGWPRCGEIDIMEMGRVTGWNQILGTIHWNAPGSPPAPEYWHAIVGSGGSNANLAVADATSAFHVYRIEWTPGQIRWFVDGNNFYTQEIASITGSPNNPFVTHDFHFLLNNAMGGHMGGTVDTAGAATTRFEIDYVRVYQLDSSNTVLTQRPALPTNPVSLVYGKNTSLTVSLQNYPHTLTVSGSVPGLTVSVQNSAQPVTGFSGSTGKAQLVLSGTPTQSGTFNLTLNAANVVGSQSLTLPVTVTGVPWSLQNPDFDLSSGGTPTSWKSALASTSPVWSNSLSVVSGGTTNASTNGWIRFATNATADGYELPTTGSNYYGSSTPFVPRTAPASLKAYGGYAAGGAGGTVRMYRVTNGTVGNQYQFEAYAHTGTVDSIGGSNVCRLYLQFLGSGSNVIATHTSTAEMNSASPRGTWTLFQTPVVTAPAGTLTIRAGTEFIQPGNRNSVPADGCVYWDDFVLKTIGPTPVSITNLLAGPALQLASGGWTEQTLLVEPYAGYRLQGSNGTTVGTVLAGVTWKNDADVAVGNSPQASSTASQSWLLSLTSPASATRATLRLEQSSGTPQIQGVAWNFAGRYRLFNGGAETLDNGTLLAWSNTGGTTNSLGITSSSPRSGSSALRVAGPTTSFDSLSGWTQEIVVTNAGTPWLAEVWSRNSVPLAGSSQGLLRLEFLNGSGSILLTGDTFLPKSSSYSRSQVYLRAPTGTAKARIFLLLNQVAYGAGELVLDDAEVRELSQSDYLASRANSLGLIGANLLPSADPDNDGVSSADEFLWGTDPYSSSSVTRASLSSPSTNLFRLQWLAVPGMTYQIERFESLANTGTPSETISISPSSSTGSASSFTATQDFPMTNSRGFFRVRTAP